MAIEIELKAWAEDVEGLKAALSRLGIYNGEFLKEDTYWFPKASSALPASGLRVRKERAGTPPRQTILATYKTKEVREGLEVNREREFTVSDGAAFEELLERLGLERGTSKRKAGFSWSVEGITAEITEVAGLGWFAELEIIAPEDTPETVTTARIRLLKLLGKLGIGEDKIEGRYYTEMLSQIHGRERGQAGQNTDG
jgi:adenylate cyclase class 2